VTHRFTLADVDHAIAAVVNRDALKVAVLP
jgi:hypothetical protein